MEEGDDVQIVLHQKSEEQVFAEKIKDDYLPLVFDCMSKIQFAAFVLSEYKVSTKCNFSITASIQILILYYWQ